MRLNREQFNKWLRALKSGKYKQTTGTLQDSIGYCCLGVACKLFIPEKKLQYEIEYDDVELPYMDGQTPNDQKYAPKWLQEINDDFENRNGKFSLITLNDDKGYTFKQIAKELEKAYPERKKKVKMAIKKRK